MWDVKNFKYTFALWPLSVQVRFSLGRRDESATENKVRAFISNYVKSKSFLKIPMKEVLSVKPLYEQYISTLLAGAVEALEFQPSEH